MALRTLGLRPRVTSRPVRVLLVSRSAVLGGVELRMALEARALAEAGMAPSVAVDLHPPLHEWRDDLERSGVPVIHFAPPPFLEKWRWHRWNRLRAGVAWVRRLRALKCELAHVFLPWTNMGGTPMWLAKRAGMRVMLSVRNTFSPEPWTNWETRHYREAFTAVRGVYGISRSALDGFVAVFGTFLRDDTRLEVIENGVDLNRFRPRPESRHAARAGLGIPDDAPVLGTVARLGVQKRPLALLGVFAAVRRRVPDAHLVFLGDGPLLEEVRARARQTGVSDAVHFPGFRHDVEDWLPAIDVHVLLSVREGFGTATAEAWAAGIPVVGTDVPGTRDILRDEDGGILVPLDDAEAAVDACARLLGDPAERLRRGAAGREAAIRRFDQRQWRERVVAFTRAVLND